MEKARYTFRVEWFDQQAALKRYYLLFYIVRMDGLDEIEIFDLKSRRTFLKKTHYPTIKLDDVYIGAKLNIYSRQLLVIDYEDEVTRKALQPAQARCAVVASADAIRSLGRMLSSVESAGLKLAKLKMVRFSPDDASVLFGARARAIAGAPSVVIELVGPDVTEVWASVVGSSSGFFTASSASEADAWLNAVFGEPSRRVPSAVTTAALDNCTCAIIKPHIVTKGLCGEVLDGIVNCGLTVSAMELFDVDLVAAEEFFEVYKNVVPEYTDMSRELSAGAFLVVELSGADAVTRFREVCGPRDIDVARRIRPDTLRARFGIDTVRNAVHCTDLEEDGPIESQYFFSILQA